MFRYVIFNLVILRLRNIITVFYVIIFIYDYVYNDYWFRVDCCLVCIFLIIIVVGERSGMTLWFSVV